VPNVAANERPRGPLGIRAGDKVLDVGCGGVPFAYATHLADLNLADSRSRFGLPIPTGARPLYECSVEDMPFGDHEFDFVFCSHVLEHVQDPAQACRELMRVGHRGYLECPRSWTEYVFSAEDHRWLVDLEGGVLVFREKLPEEFGDPLGIQYSIFEWLEDPAFQRRWNAPALHRQRTVQVLWNGSFDFRVLSRAERGEVYAPVDRMGGSPLRLGRKSRAATNVLEQLLVRRK
jgi:SAM-dependent methyltransferase